MQVERCHAVWPLHSGDTNVVEYTRFGTCNVAPCMEAMFGATMVVL